jgi:hypothetical protein
MPDQPTSDENKAPAKATGGAGKRPTPAGPPAGKPAGGAREKADGGPAEPPAEGAAGTPSTADKPVAAEGAGSEPAAPGDGAAQAEETLTAQDREALRKERAEDARRRAVGHDKKVRRFLLRLSLANWGVAVLSWTISAFLGITSPASIILYSVLFVVGLVAASIAILTYLLERFGHEPSSLGPIGTNEDDDATEDGTTPASEGDTMAPAAT